MQSPNPFLKGMNGRTGVEQMVERSEIVSDEGYYESEKCLFECPGPKFIRSLSAYGFVRDGAVGFGGFL